MKSPSNPLRSKLFLCVVLAGTALLHGQAPSIKINGDVNPGTTISVTGTPASAVLTVYLPQKAGVICGSAGQFDWGSPVLISDGGKALASTIKLSGTTQPISLGTAVKTGDTLCLHVAVGNDEAFYSQKVASPARAQVQFADKPVAGSNTISVLGDENAVVAVVQFDGNYTPDPKSENCSAADFGNGQLLRIGAKDPTTNSIPLGATKPFLITLNKPLQPGTKLCLYAVETAAGAGGATTKGYSPFTTVTAAPVVTATPGCNTQGTFSDCRFEYMLIGGIEQADLSAQSSVTEGFYDLFLRRPVGSKWGSIWFRSRFLGTPSSSSTQNIVAAASNPTGTLTAANLPQSVAAVDYVLGFQFDFGRIGKNRITYSPIAAFGATTPLSATTTVSGFVVPAYGTNECNQLQTRFGAKQGYSPSLPSSGLYGTAPGTMGCVVQPNPQSTTSNPLPGTQITDIVFSNEDRSSFLVKYGAGVRIIDRAFPAGSTDCSSSAGCSRLMADFTLGQDQAITRGYLRHFVLKADAIIPVFSTGIYFFASSANRLEHNATLSPLILSPVTVTANSGTTACTSPTVCVPSASVFVLPYKQQNRDDYRIGIGIDLIKVFTKLFPQSAPTAAATDASTTTPAALATTPAVKR